MPHIILEHSANIPLPGNAQDLLKDLHDTLISCHTSYNMIDIKSRIITHENYRVSDGTREQGFVHLQLAILPRDPDVRKSTAEKLGARLQELLAPSLAGKNYAISVETRELDKNSYVKAAGGNL